MPLMGIIHWKIIQQIHWVNALSILGIGLMSTMSLETEKTFNFVLQSILHT